MPLTNVVARSTPFQRTIEPATKLLPFAVSVNAPAPAVADAGAMDPSAGAGLFVPMTVRLKLSNR